MSENKVGVYQILSYTGRQIREKTDPEKWFAVLTQKSTRFADGSVVQYNESSALRAEMKIMLRSRL